MTVDTAWRRIKWRSRNCLLIDQFTILHQSRSLLKLTNYNELRYEENRIRSNLTDEHDPPTVLNNFILSRSQNLTVLQRKINTWSSFHCNKQLLWRRWSLVDVVKCTLSDWLLIDFMSPSRQTFDNKEGQQLWLHGLHSYHSALNLDETIKNAKHDSY